MNKVVRSVICVVATLAIAGCGGESNGDAPPEDSETAARAPAPTVQAPTGPIDETLAATGEQLFTTKGCVGCHTIGGGKLTGPDLEGLVTRREFAWTMAMITNPDSMLKSDATARQLLGEYMTPMVNMGVTSEEARALYEHLRRTN